VNWATVSYPGNIFGFMHQWYCFQWLPSRGNNQTQGKVKFQTARFADATVFSRRHSDNSLSHRQTDKQMSAVDICDGILFLFENLFCGEK
jgi:hypothetical protein